MSSSRMMLRIVRSTAVASRGMAQPLGFVASHTLHTGKCEAPLHGPNQNDSIHHPDIFGTLSNRGNRKLAVHEVEEFYPDDEDGYDKEEYDLTPRKNAFYYKYEIAKYARKGSVGLKKALELFQEMKSEARLTPTYENFSPLFYGCAKAGYTKRAFELYEEFLKYERKPSLSIVSCLLNACAECPFPEYGIKRLEWFLTELKVKFAFNLNLIQYNAAIKAYGKLGQLEEASKLVQEMIDQGISPDLSTFQSLLIGCASNKESGSSLALRVFKRLKLYDIQPTTVTYRLLLRCIRDCKLGSDELIQVTINELPAVTTLQQRLEYKKRGPRRDKRFRQTFEWAPILTDLGRSVAGAVSEQQKTSATDKSFLIQTSPATKSKQSTASVSTTDDSTMSNHTARQRISEDSNAIVEAQTFKLPNLLSDDHLDIIKRLRGLRVDMLQSNHGRLILFGGLHGFIEAMLKDGCKPDLKTLMLLLACLESSKENFLQIFELSENFKIKRDIDFYDQLIWYICKDHRDQERLEFALDFIQKIHADDLRPTISTYEALAMGCNRWTQAKQLVDDLEKSNFSLSPRLIANFFDVAIRRKNYHYLYNLISLSQRYNFEPSKCCIERLEALKIVTSQLIAKQDAGVIDQTLESGKIELFDKFCKTFDNWVKDVTLMQKDHPWGQYYVPTKSKKNDYFKFVKHLKAMEKVKKETLEKGRGHLGNIAYEAQKLLQQDSSA